MSNCCDAWGRCTQSANCPVREAAHTRAAEQFCRPEGLPVAMWEPEPLPRHIRILDRIGNWWDDLNELGRISSVVGVIAVCAAAGVAAVG